MKFDLHDELKSTDDKWIGSVPLREIANISTIFISIKMMPFDLCFRDEAYRFVWRELEHLIVAFKDTSEAHRQVYQSVVERAKLDGGNDAPIYPR